MPFSFLHAPVDKGEICFTEEFATRANNYIASLEEGGFSPRIFVNIKNNIFLKQFPCIIHRVIPFTHIETFDLARKLFSFFYQRDDEFAIQVITGGYLHRKGYRQFCVVSYQMNLLPEKKESLELSPQFTIMVCFKSSQMDGIHRDSQLISFNDSHCLSNQTGKYSLKSFFPHTFSEIMKSIMERCLIIRKSAEKRGLPIKLEPSEQASLRVRITQVDKKKIDRSKSHSMRGSSIFEENLTGPHSMDSKIIFKESEGEMREEILASMKESCFFHCVLPVLSILPEEHTSSKVDKRRVSCSEGRESISLSLLPRLRFNFLEQIFEKKGGHVI